MKKKNLIALFLFLCLLTGPSFALDTDLYVLSGVNIPPNVLIILDSSASMDEVSSGQLYSSGMDYSSYVPPTGTIYPMNQVYIKSTGNKWIETAIPGGCLSLQDLLNEFGEAINFSGCGYNKKDFQIW